MSNDPDEWNPEEPEAHLNIEDIMTTGHGMKMSRMREIEKADERGEPLDIAPEERQEYEEGKAELAEVMQSFRRRMMEPFEAINEHLRNIVTGTFRAPKLDVPRMKTPDFMPPKRGTESLPDITHKPRLPKAPNYTPIEPLISKEELDSTAEASRKREERQEQTQNNTFDTAVAMKQMLDEMEKQSKRDTQRWWWVFAVTVLTLIFAGVAVFPTMSTFFEQAWQMITGG